MFLMEEPPFNPSNLHFAKWEKVTEALVKRT